MGQATVRLVPEFSFEVEQAGCASCAARVRGALAPLLEISALEVDEMRDAAVITARAAEELPMETVDELLGAASEGAGHTYRVKPGSWRLAS